MLDQRLVRLLSSLIEKEGEYALARLELGMRAPEVRLPPVLPRLADASETTLRTQWGEFEARLEEIAGFVKRNAADRRNPLRSDPAFRWLRSTYRELDQYARALRWVLTVTERSTDEPE